MAGPLPRDEGSPRRIPCRGSSPGPPEERAQGTHHPAAWPPSGWQWPGGFWTLECSWGVVEAWEGRQNVDDIRMWGPRLPRCEGMMGWWRGVVMVASASCAGLGVSAWPSRQPCEVRSLLFSAFHTGNRGRVPRKQGARVRLHFDTGSVLAQPAFGVCPLGVSELDVQSSSTRPW